MHLIGEQEIDDIARGATVLGTGGGGDPYIGRLLAIESIRQYGPVRLIEAGEVPDYALVVPCAMMGAPTVIVEKLPKGDELVDAFRSLSRFLGEPVFAAVCAEVGGLNSTTPFTVAARLGIPLVDADTMGRAFPELQMCMMTLHGISATPMSICDEKGNSAIIRAIDNRWTEALARTLTVEMGATAMIALYPMRGHQLKQAAVLGTLSLAQQIGALMRACWARKENPIDAVLALLGGLRLFSGKLVDVQRRTVSGFARGEAVIDGDDDWRGRRLTIQFQNENLLASLDGDTVASVPDLITICDAESGMAITTEELRYGFRVVVVGMPCDRRWRSPEGLAVVGPRYFGYDSDYVPVERGRPAPESI
ncbi:MAG: DUF917 domain-containing protein [Dehalococcoidia bacterium]